MNSSAKEYFEALKAGGYDAIARLPTEPEPTFENDWRDFKGWYAGKDDELKAAWSKAITAFANTQGGVVLWGVVANVGPGSNIDRVTGLAEVSSPADWIQKLKNWKLQATDPPIGNIEYCPIIHPTQPKGFVACLIPESEFKPHRAEFSHKNYYIRAGDSSVIPSPSLLRSLFFPKARMDVWLNIESRVDHEYNRSHVLLRMENRGYSSVRNGVIRMLIRPDREGARRSEFRANEAELIGNAAATAVAFRMRAELHPGMTTMFGHIQTNLRFIGLTAILYQSDCAPLHVFVEPDFVREKDGTVQLVPLDDKDQAALSDQLADSN
jgi:hypothetical protein